MDAAPLDFIGVGIMSDDAGDAAYVYTVECGNVRNGDRPAVTYAEA